MRTRTLLLLALLAAGPACTTEMPESPWTPFDPLLYCTWTEAGGACAGEGDSEGRVLSPRSAADPELVRLGDGWALNTELAPRTSAEISDALIDWGRLNGAITVAAIVQFDELPTGRMAVVSKWDTSEQGRTLELGMEWDGHPYFLVSGDGNTDDMGVVYADAPVVAQGSAMFVGVLDPDEGVSIYVNGERVGLSHVHYPRQLFASATPLLLGIRNGCGDACAFDGAVGDVGIFARAFTAEEVLDLARAFGMDGSMLRPFLDPEPTAFDLDEVGQLVEQQLADLDSGEGPGQYRWNPGDAEAQLYSSADVAWIRWIMDATDELPADERAGWIAYLQSYQLETDGRYAGANVTDDLHALAHVTGALRMLGGGHRYPVTFIDDLLQPVAIGPWLDGRDWFYQWGSSCAIWGLGLAALSTESTSSEWRTAFFDWLDAELDPEIGAWRRGHDVNAPVDYVGGGFHLWTLYTLEGRPIPYPERVIDTVLAVQSADGDWSRSFGCGTLDGVWILAQLKDESDYRGHDVDVALRRSLHGMMELVDRGIFHETASHGLLSRVATMALLQRALPGELASEHPWRDPWTNPSLFDLE
jgi:hypothetical protein